MVNSFAAVLDMKPEEIERTPPIPTGIYIGTILKPYESGEIKSDKGEWETMTLMIGEFDPDIVEDLDLYNGDIRKAAPVRLQFMFDKNDEAKFNDTLNRVKTFLSKHVGCWEEGTPLKKGLADAVKQRVKFEVSHRTNPQDQEQVFAEIKRTMPMEA